MAPTLGAHALLEYLFMLQLPHTWPRHMMLSIGTARPAPRLMWLRDPLFVVMLGESRGMPMCCCPPAADRPTRAPALFPRLSPDRRGAGNSVIALI